MEAVSTKLHLDPDRLFPTDPATRDIARGLYESVAQLPIISPHGHVAPSLLLDDEPFSDPADLFITYDHYVTRLLHAAGVDLADARSRPQRAVRSPRDLAHLREPLAPLRGHGIGLLADARARRRSSTSTSSPRQRRPMPSTTRSPLASATRHTARAPSSSASASRCSPPPTTPWTTSRCTPRSPPTPSFTGRVLPTFRPDGYLDPTAPGFPSASNGSPSRTAPHPTTSPATSPRSRPAGRTSSRTAPSRPTTGCASRTPST